MPSKGRFNTKYPGVYYIIGTSVQGKDERIYYVRYRKNGKLIEEKAGKQFQDDMTPARAAGIRSERIEGKRLSRQETRQQEAEAKTAETEKYTIDKLWKEYKMNRNPGKGLGSDMYRYEKHIKTVFGNKEPKELIKLDLDRMRINLSKRLSPQSVKHILNLLTWIINYGTKNNLCEGISFHIQKPSVNNEKTEDLSPEQLTKLLDAIEQDENIDVGRIMKIALYTGMRKGEIFKLQWQDINFDNGFIFLHDPKGGVDQKIPMNDMA
ncbi:MAG: integrase, partial [Pseudomonadota bacterium]